MAKPMLKVVDNSHQLTRVQDERDRLAEFTKYIMGKLWDRDDIDLLDCQTRALELGLIFEDIATEEDSEKNWYAEPGEPWYRLQPWLEEIEPVSGY